MKDNTKSEIDSMLEQYNKDNEERLKQIEVSKTNKKKFEEEFDNLKVNVILPVMKQFQEYLEKKGEKGQIDSVSPGDVTFNVTPSHHAFSGSPVRISFLGTINKKVAVMITPSGRANSFSEEFELSDISNEFVEDRILETMKESFH